MRVISRLCQFVASHPFRAATAAVLPLVMVATFAGSSSAVAQHNVEPVRAAADTVAGKRSPWPGGVWKPGPARYGQILESDVVFRMPDNTTLVANILVPANRQTGKPATGRFPVIVTMTPYYITIGSLSQSTPDYMVEHGYIHVEFDVPGTGRSSGTYSLFSPQQLRDFVELAEYCATHLPNANGTAALAGQSYLGTDTLAAARYIRPGSPIKAIFAASAGSDWYRELFNGGGVPTTFSDIYAAAKFVRGGGIAPGYNRQIRTGGPLMYHGSFWDSRAPIDSVPAIVKAHLPVLLVSGEADFPAMTSLEMYTALQNEAQGRSIWAPMDPTARTSGLYQLVWGTQSDPEVPYSYDYYPYELEWLDTFLKGVQTGVANTRKPLHLYEWQLNQWTNTAAYPITKAYTQYFFTGHPTGPQPYANNNGGLSTRPPSGATGGDKIKWAPPAAPPTPRTAANILDYTSQPFKNGALIAGPITAHIYARSTTKNIMLIATLEDVAPDGKVTSVFHDWNADGTLLGTERSVNRSRSWYDNAGHLIFAYHPFTAQGQELVKPGRPVTMDVQLTPRMWAVLPGHRIRVQITTQEPGLMTPTGPQVRALHGATFVISRSAAEASYINLPVLPLHAFTSNNAWAQTKYTYGPNAFPVYPPVSTPITPINVPPHG